MLYLLGSGFKSGDTEEKYPYQVLLNTEKSDSVIGLTEGKGIGGVGGSFSAQQLLKPHFQENFEICKVEWLIPIIKEAVNDECEIDPQVVLDTYQYKFGSSPPLAKKY